MAWRLWAGLLLGVGSFVSVACGGRASAPVAPAAAPPSATAAPATGQAQSAPTDGAYQTTLLSPAVPVRVGVIGGSSDAGIYIAYEKGYFRDEGLDVEIIPFANSSDTVG